ncbi:MAG TPA: glutamine amidotransferase family protein [Methanospirillum sp.]|uniref:class II glutamine amidotransferase n=1 Tax=Methanospirillum sp. TaxID=45200 RepID=UPI002BE71CEB|nr:glutamine amidotransferase family protein [Methanospirillum sp.]HWQ64958.1 glutamine amidotransferase family protein [Methanospirillum sp.]
MCGIIGVIDKTRETMDGSAIREALAIMDERGNGEGAGYAAYGVYPDYADLYAIHVFYDNIVEPKEKVEELLETWGMVEHDEEIPTHETGRIKKVHIPWRYFFRPNRKLMPQSDTPEDDIVTQLVMHVNTKIPGALIFSSGKNIGVFKASGWPEEVADFYRVEDYEGYLWIAHNRYPTNTAGWWGGAHPFNLLNWSVVHNGEITSYGTNRRYIESFGYICRMYTDTEVVAYLMDLLARKHKLSPEHAVRALAPPFWEEIERMEPSEQELNTAIRLTYGQAMMNGPFAIAVASHDSLVGFSDRIKLRPLVIGEHDQRLYVSSEEAAIRTMDPDVKKISMPRAGQPIVGRVVA